jgi:single-strand DNA-binding protein
MSRSLNKVMLIGNVGNDPEIRATSSGARVAKLSVATNRSWSDRSGQQQEKTEWHRLTFFGRLVDIVEQWVNKGDRLYVEGRLEYSQTQDDQGGTRYWTDIVVNEMVMLGSTGRWLQRWGRWRIRTFSLGAGRRPALLSGLEAKQDGAASPSRWGGPVFNSPVRFTTTTKAHPPIPTTP